MSRNRVLSVRLDEELWQAFRDLAHQRGLRVSHVLRGLIRGAVRDDEFAEFDMTEAEFDAAFYEDDEPVADIVAAFECGPKATTLSSANRIQTWRCKHMTISGPMTQPPQTKPCLCKMEQVS